MGIGAVAAGMGEAQTAADARDETDRKLLCLEHRALLDMQLDEGGDVLPFQVALTAEDRRRVAAGLGQMLAQGPAIVRTAHVKRLGVEPAEGRMRADIGAVEPGGLLGPDGHDGDVAPGPDAEPAEAGKSREPRHHPGSAVEIAALGHGIHMRADDEAWQRAIPARHRHVEV